MATAPLSTLFSSKQSASFSAFHHSAFSISASRLPFRSQNLHPLNQNFRSSISVSRVIEQSHLKTALGGITEVNNDSFWPFVEEAGAKIVVLDMYTQWCGPCKLILPKILALSEKYSDVAFAKLDCNQENKALAKQLGIKAVPTFKILKNKEVVAEVRGAKFEELVKAIENARTNL